MLVLALVGFGGDAPRATAQEAPDCESADIGQDPPDGCLIIVKATDPEGADQAFDFELTAGDDTAEEFSLGDQEQFGLALTEAGAYAVTELSAEGWTLADIECSGSLTVEQSVEESTVSFEVSDQPDGDSVRCVFTNSEDAAGDDAADDDPDASTEDEDDVSEDDGDASNQDDDDATEDDDDASQDDEDASSQDDDDATEDDEDASTEDDDNASGDDDNASAQDDGSAAREAALRALANAAETDPTPEAERQAEVEAETQRAAPISPPATGDAGLR